MKPEFAKSIRHRRLERDNRQRDQRRPRIAHHQLPNFRMRFDDRPRPRRMRLLRFRLVKSCLHDSTISNNQSPSPFFSTSLSAGYLFPFRAAEQGKHKEVCQDVNDAAREDDKAEALRGWKIGEDKNREASGDDDVGINDAAPLFFAREDPGGPAFFAVALGAPDAEDKMNHRVDEIG